MVKHHAAHAFSLCVWINWGGVLSQQGPGRQQTLPFLLCALAAISGTGFKSLLGARWCGNHPASLLLLQDCVTKASPGLVLCHRRIKLERAQGFIPSCGKWLSLNSTPVLLNPRVVWPCFGAFSNIWRLFCTWLNKTESRNAFYSNKILNWVLRILNQVTTERRREYKMQTH